MKEPRTVRNYWIEVEIDGYKNTIKGGTRNKDGGLEVTLYQRDGGNISTAVTISSYVNKYGVLVTEVKDNDGNVVFSYTTER